MKTSAISSLSQRRDDAHCLLRYQVIAVIDNDALRSDIRLPVTLQQTVWVEYKRKCLF